MDPVDVSVLRDIFTFHPPDEQQKEAYIRIREKGYELALEILSSCPRGPDREHAIRHIREATMNANASIATRNAANHAFS